MVECRQDGDCGDPPEDEIDMDKFWGSGKSYNRISKFLKKSVENFNEENIKKADIILITVRGGKYDGYGGVAYGLDKLEHIVRTNKSEYLYTVQFNLNSYELEVCLDMIKKIKHRVDIDLTTD